jgi:hypothetical protein
MNLLQRFYSAVIDASDVIGASMQGVAVKTHRANIYGHPDGIVAARAAGVAPQAAGDDQGDDGGYERTPFYVARTSDIPLYQTLAEDLERDGM